MILGTSRAVRVFAYPEPVDLRKGYDGLYGLVKMGLGRDPLSGELFLFVNKRRGGCKVLVWDGTGLCIFQKRLARGRFASLFRDDGKSVQLTASELALFIEGCEPARSAGAHSAPPWSRSDDADTLGSTRCARAPAAAHRCSALRARPVDR